MQSIFFPGIWKRGKISNLAREKEIIFQTYINIRGPKETLEALRWPNFTYWTGRGLKAILIIQSFPLMSSLFTFSCDLVGESVPVSMNSNSDYTLRTT